MISPMTPPGTEVVCIDDDWHGPTDLDHPVLGGIYTVTEIRPFTARPGFGATLSEIPFGLFDLAAFRLLDLAGLDALLDIKEPVDA